jgi:hypothetical protein
MDHVSSGSAIRHAGACRLVARYTGRRNSFLIPVLCLLIFSGGAQAQSFKLEADRAWHVTKAMVEASLHGSTGDYLIAAGIVSGLALSSTLDRPAHSAARKVPAAHAKTINEIGHQMQGPAVIFGTTGALYGYGLLADDHRARRIGWEIVESYGIAAVGTHVLKRAVGRHRPYQDDGPFAFSGFNVSNNGHQSFPSGDVTVAFAFLSVLAAEANTVPATVLFYGLGSLTMFQRMNRNQHWFSDALTGAFWGSVVGNAVVHYNRAAAASPVKLSLGPQPAMLGLTIDL